jgi:outer membrane protein insertion porin family
MSRPAADLARDIISPCAGNSIAARQAGDKRHVNIKHIEQDRRLLRQLAASGMLIAALGASVVAVAAEIGSSSRDTIVVEGNRRVDAETVRSYFHAASDGQFDDASRDAALKELVRTGLFDKVSIERTGEGLVIHLTEAPVLDRVAFEGNKKIKDTDLSAAVESKPRGTLQRAAVQADVGRIIEAYRHVGRDDVSVVPQIINRGSDRVDLVYTITEGAKTPVRQINFTGNQVFGKRQLNAVIKTSATNMLSFLTGGDVYDPDRVAQDQEQLRLYYRSKGYADASVPSARAEYDPATRGFTLTFAIDEGPLYHFGDVSIVCNIPGLDPEKLRRLLFARTGAVFDGNALDKTTEVLAMEMAKLGYPFAQAVVRPARDAAARRVDIAFVIDQGPRTYVERIEIHGNTRTRDYVIRREFDVAEGDAYNKTLIDRAERRLKNLSYFKTVKI